MEEKNKKNDVTVACALEKGNMNIIEAKRKRIEWKESFENRYIKWK